MRVSLKEKIKLLTAEDVPMQWRIRVNLKMARKNLLVNRIKKELDEEGTTFLFAWRMDAFRMKEIVEIQGLFPPGCKVRHLKNSLVKKAMEGTEWWPFARRLRGQNMFVFVKDDADIKPAIEAALRIEKKYFRTDKLAELYEKYSGKEKMTYVLEHWYGGIYKDDWTFFRGKDVVKCKDLPTKTELIARIARGVKQVTQKLAVGVKQVPQKLAIGTKKIVEKMEEDGKATVGDAVA